MNSKQEQLIPGPAGCASSGEASAPALPAFAEATFRGVRFAPALFCAPLADLTHSAYRRLLADFGGCGAACTEMLNARKLLQEDFDRSPYVKRRPVEKRLIYQLMFRADDPVEAIVERLARVEPDGLDLNLACYAPVIRQIDAGSRLFENVETLAAVLGRVRKAWPGLLTVKIRLGRSTVAAGEYLPKRLAVIEEAGVDAVTLHTRFFEDKFKRRARHELFSWAADMTRLPVIANGDILGPGTLQRNPAAFARVRGLMIGRMAIARPWLFAAWARPVEVDHGEVWQRLAAYIEEDFTPVLALRRLKLFTTYYARNFLFGHHFSMRVRNSGTLEQARVEAREFFRSPQPLVDEPSLAGL